MNWTKARGLHERIDSAKVATVVLVDFVRGTGKPDDPVRRCLAVFDTDGAFLAEHDSLEEMTT